MPFAISDAMRIAASWIYDGKDQCGRFFTKALKACDPDLHPDARVLEIGCAEFNWLSHAHRSWPEMSLTGIDARTPLPVNGATTFSADVLTYDFPPAAFDWVVLVSALEHIGMGYYGDPVCEDGDSRTMRRIYEWLAPGGWVSFDVPHGTAYDVRWGSKLAPKERVYNESAIRTRLHQGLPWQERWAAVMPLRNRDSCWALWWQKPLEVA